MFHQLGGVTVFRGWRGFRIVDVAASGVPSAAPSRVVGRRLVDGFPRWGRFRRTRSPFIVSGVVLARVGAPKGVWIHPSGSGESTVRPLPGRRVPPRPSHGAHRRSAPGALPHRRAATCLCPPDGKMGAFDSFALDGYCHVGGRHCRFPDGLREVPPVL